MEEKYLFVNDFLTNPIFISPTLYDISTQLKEYL